MISRFNLSGARDAAIALIGAGSVDLLEASGIKPVYSNELETAPAMTLEPVQVRARPSEGRDAHVILTQHRAPFTAAPANDRAAAELREALAVADLDGKSLGVELNDDGLIVRSWVAQEEA